MLVPSSIRARVGVVIPSSSGTGCVMTRTLHGYELRFSAITTEDDVVLVLDDRAMLLSGAWNDVSRLRNTVTELISTQLPSLNTEVAVNDTLALINLFLQNRSNK